MNLSLMTMIRDDVNFQARLAAKCEEVKQDKVKILSFADSYSKKYDKEIEEGDKLKRNLLSEGASKGMSEEEAIANYGKFVPARNTPILNMLYFLLRESDGDEFYGKRLYEQRDTLNGYLKSTYKSEDDIIENDDKLRQTLNDIYEETRSNQIRVNANQKLKSETTNEDIGGTNEPEMVEFLYGNLTLDTFNKIKKLKALAQSDNIDEACLAYRKALEMCKTNNLEYDKIPCYVKK